jgi:hypothetical protein
MLSIHHLSLLRAERISIPAITSLNYPLYVAMPVSILVKESKPSELFAQLSSRHIAVLCDVIQTHSGCPTTDNGLV